MTGPVLVGVDGSEGSQRALSWALEEARVREATVEAVIVWQSPYDFPRDFYYPVNEAKLAERAKVRLAEAVGDAPGEHAGVEIAPIVLEGDPAGTLCKRAAAADLLVVGSRGHGTFTGLLLGSVSSKCAHHSPKPVVIVPGPDCGDRGPSFGATGRIVVGVDGSDGSRGALRWAIDEAEARGATVEALAVWRGTEARDDMSLALMNAPSPAQPVRATENVQEHVKRFVIEALGTSKVEVEPVVLEGDPAETLCRRAAEADLLVVGSRGRGAFAELRLGSVSAKCAHHSPRPVVIVPTGRHAHVGLQNPT